MKKLLILVTVFSCTVIATANAQDINIYQYNSEHINGVYFRDDIGGVESYQYTCNSDYCGSSGREHTHVKFTNYNSCKVTVRFRVRTRVWNSSYSNYGEINYFVGTLVLNPGETKQYHKFFYTKVVTVDEVETITRPVQY